MLKQVDADGKRSTSLPNRSAVAALSQGTCAHSSSGHCNMSYTGNCSGHNVTATLRTQPVVNPSHGTNYTELSTIQALA